MELKELDNRIRNIVRQMQGQPQTTQASTIPVGGAMLWTGPTSKIPVGFVLADGTNRKISDYSALYQIIGSSYNSGTPAGSFRVPNYATITDSATATVGRWVIRYV